MNTKGISKSRKRLLDLSRLIANLSAEVLVSKPMTKGTVCDLRRKCGNKNCKCAYGEPHFTKVLSSSHNGKTRLLCLTKYPVLQLSKIERQVKSYRQFRRNRAELVHSFNLLLAEINKLEKNLLVEVPPKKGEFNGKRKRKGKKRKQ
ncbi:MAG: DUF6788 family protein [Acidobacteriota bacterium]|nr:DUF6788 family protein [Acidobacteriota bacterium]